ncbi:C-X-C motif chemokine 16 [Calonectris borealis]|uniref:C-X-C motif chemokine 16 n=1 Tax=Calonectris borealis TaxID=1323832 RepID=UPI003F4C025A
MGPGLLLLLLPWGALGNVGSWAGACACTHRWSREPPPAVRLPPLAPRVLRAELCPNHVRRFVLPHMRLCGLQNSPWVVELLQLWQHRAAQRPPATDGPPDGPTDRPPDRPMAGPRTSPLAPRSPPAPQGPPASPTARRSPPPSSPSASRPPGDPQALPPTPVGWIHQEAVGQDPQSPLPAGGVAPLSVGLAVGLVLLGVGLGLGGVLACRGGCRGAGRGPPPPPEAPLLSPRWGGGHSPCELL